MFTIRGISKPETLNLTVSGKGTGTGNIKRTMAFDRNDYGRNSGIPFIKIADLCAFGDAMDCCLQWSFHDLCNVTVFPETVSEKYLANNSGTQPYETVDGLA